MFKEIFNANPFSVDTGIMRREDTLSDIIYDDETPTAVKIIKIWLLAISSGWFIKDYRYDIFGAL